MTAAPSIPDTLPLVLRPSRAGTLAALGAGTLFSVVGLALAASGNWIVAVIVLAFAAVGLWAGVMGVLPHRSELRLDEQGLGVVSPVKTWKAGWEEIERFEPDTIAVGRRSRVEVVRVVYRDGFDTAHSARSLPGRALGVDEHYVMPAYGNLDDEQLCALLTAFRERFGS
jgi:hypothetical protein